ncbi:hypothetical protein INR77_09090 [Erythrobacter sp. SCSIO 43205]|uniref:hypothetical protein n=1 Tax=Erythrobacter sp. SCSIO 43205 TaxID=2779361 RepID=UPI001CA835B4|nr:hypothetical protein [Erythrobacter sp. SCSIO 43205]UAB77001.1 hypothetical protein INR77_09090 [Erythrobacter sp. SCSIO 43205]
MSKDLEDIVVHSAEGMTLRVACGGGAVMVCIDPRSFTDGGPEWVMRYGNPESIRYTVAELLGSYDYLLSEDINTKEARRRLGLMRKARRIAVRKHLEKTNAG